MRHAWTIAKNDLSLRARDRSIYIIGLVAPLALAFIFNAVFGGGISDVGETITFEVGIANVDQGPIGAAFEDVIDVDLLGLSLRFRHGVSVLSQAE